jgi:hypothetical protein
VCGGARLSSGVSEIKLAFSIPPEQPTPILAASWNVAPTDPLPIVHLRPQERRAASRSCVRPHPLLGEGPQQDDCGGEAALCESRWPTGA